MDLPNFFKDVLNFVKDVPRGPKSISKWGLSLLKCVQRNKWTIGNKIGVLVAQGFDVPNIFNDVPNIVNDVPNFVNDVPRGLKSISKWGTTSNHFLRFSKGINRPWEER